MHKFINEIINGTLKIYAKKKQQIVDLLKQQKYKTY
jgi:hypothetical protein